MTEWFSIPLEEPAARNRWRIGVDLSRHLNATGERVPLVFITRGPAIEIGRFRASTVKEEKSRRNSFAGHRMWRPEKTSNARFVVESEMPGYQQTFGKE